MLENKSFPPLTLDDCVVELRRCEDDFLRKALALSMPIQVNTWWMLTLLGQLGLPQVYAALTELTGPSSELYDVWKGAFSFPFKLTVRRDGREYRYLLRLTSYRSGVEPSLYRLLKPGESYERSFLHAPFDDELSSKEVTQLVGFVAGFLEGYLETAPRWTTPFVKEVRSNLLLFGFDPRAGAFFEESYDTEEAYEAALEHWHALIPKEAPEREWVERHW